MVSERESATVVDRGRDQPRCYCIVIVILVVVVAAGGGVTVVVGLLC